MPLTRPDALSRPRVRRLLRQVGFVRSGPARLGQAPSGSGLAVRLAPSDKPSLLHHFSLASPVVFWTFWSLLDQEQIRTSSGLRPSGWPFIWARRPCQALSFPASSSSSGLPRRRRPLPSSGRQVVLSAGLRVRTGLGCFCPGFTRPGTGSVRVRSPLSGASSSLHLLTKPPPPPSGRDFGHQGQGRAGFRAGPGPFRSSGPCLRLPGPPTTGSPGSPGTWPPRRQGHWTDLRLAYLVAFWPGAFVLQGALAFRLCRARPSFRLRQALLAFALPSGYFRVFGSLGPFSFIRLPLTFITCFLRASSGFVWPPGRVVRVGQPAQAFGLLQAVRPFLQAQATLSSGPAALPSSLPGHFKLAPCRLRARLALAQPSLSGLHLVPGPGLLGQTSSDIRRRRLQASGLQGASGSDLARVGQLRILARARARAPGTGHPRRGFRPGGSGLLHFRAWALHFVRVWTTSGLRLASLRVVWLRRHFIITGRRLQVTVSGRAPGRPFVLPSLLRRFRPCLLQAGSDRSG